MKTKNIIILVLLFVVGIISFFLAKSITTKEDDTKIILFNVFSSVTVIFLIELIIFFRDWFRFSFLRGTYKRVKIFGEDPEKKSDSKYVDMTQTYISNNVSSKITLCYIGDGKYRGKAFYDKGVKGETNITLKLDSENPMTGSGTYQYLDKTIIDLGTYNFQIDIDKKTIYIFYSNLLPSGLAKGYEVWEQQAND